MGIHEYGWGAIIITNITDGLHIGIFRTNLLVESTETALQAENENKLKIIKYLSFVKKIFFEINALKSGATSNIMDEFSEK